MRVPTNSNTDTVLAQLQKLASRQAELQTQVATGQRVFSPSDDPSAVGRLVTAQSEQREVLQFQKNANAALALSNATFSNLTELKRVSDRAGELATLGTGVAGPDAMRAYAAEVDQLVEQAVSLGNASFRNEHLFAGTAVDSVPVAVTRDANGSITAVNYGGDDGVRRVPLGEGTQLAAGADSSTNRGVVDLVANLVALRDALRSGDSTAVQDLRDSLGQSEDVLVDSLSFHGAVQLRVEVSQNQLQARMSELDRLVASDSEVDLAETIVRLSETSTAYEAALASSSKIMQLSLLDYLR